MYKVEPYFCYLIMATQLAVYAAGTWLAVAQGPDAAEAMARELAMQPKAGGFTRCTCSQQVGVHAVFHSQYAGHQLEHALYAAAVQVVSAGA